MDKLWIVGWIAVALSLAAGMAALDRSHAGAIGLPIGVAGAAITTGLILVAHAIAGTSRKP